jgi:internalin A
METIEKLIPVTPAELHDILDQLEVEHTTRLAIIGPQLLLPSDPSHWSHPYRGQPVFQLSESTSGLVDRVIRLHLLDHLVLWGLQLGDAGARCIAKHLTKLTSLNLDYNKIGVVGGRAIGEHLTQLTSLNLSDNQIGDNVARTIAAHLPQLNSLDVSGNKISEAGARAIAAHLPQLNSLDVSGNKISEAGARAIAEHLSQLNSLDISGNKIGEAGARIIAEQLPQLTSLYIGSNNIGDAGARIIAERLSQLTSLYIGSNNIGGVGARAIAERLSQLTSLYIGSNNIGDTGARAIAEHLTKLQRLWLDHNKVGQATIDVLGQRLRGLTRLSIEGNEDVRDIEPLTGLPELRHLNVSETSVSDLGPFAERIANGWPVQSRRWRFEDGLLVAKCPLVRPTVEIAQHGPESVRNYFRELAAQGEDFLYEAKVLILGEGGAGKTSLLRRLYQPDRELPSEDQTTRGIDIHRQDFVGNHGQPFRLNVWDFGGQQIYHATHQFFLTKNSLYLLVDDTRKDDKTMHDEGFKFWLEVVETLSESSPLLIFQNEKGDRSKTIDQTGIQGRFANVKEVYRGNLEKPGSVRSLQQAIECFVQQLPHIGERVPKKWVAIREDLEQLAKHKAFISQDDYFAAYGRHLQFDRTKALFLSQYLHDLGVFLHFQKDDRLSKTVILQNDWATDAVFRILDDETIKSQRGLFTAADCRRLWAEDKYSDMHAELRGLMEKFELCYRLTAPHPEQWLAPQLLSPSKPPELAQWAKPDDLVLRFQYPFLPRGLVSRLMVRQHRFVQQLGNCWAHGAFFEQNGTSALVEETAKGNEIELRARGPEHKALLSVLSNELEALNDSFKGLKGRVEKLVPCLCATCRTTTDPEMFKQSLLVERKHAGKKLTIECHKSGDDVNLLELLDGLKLEHLPTWAAKPSKPEGAATASKKATTKTAGKTAAKKKTKEKADLKAIKIFLASSAELRDDRNEFDLYFRQQNDHLKEEGIYLQIVRWEHFLDAMSKTRLQDEYNQALRDCDIVVSLFKTKVGKFTEEEFDVAWAAFKANDKPKIFTFFREFQMTNAERRAMKNDLDSLDRFEQKLTDLGHFHTKYKDAEHLKRQFRDQLTQLGLLK